MASICSAKDFQSIKNTAGEALLNLYDAAIEDIRAHYSSAGFEIGQITPGQEEAKAFRTDLRAEPFGALYAFVDEMLFAYRYIQYYFVSAMAADEKSASTYARLSAFVRTTLTSVRLLCSHGMNSNALLQLRLLHETAILWCRFIVDRDALTSFEGCHTPALSRRFYRAYIDGGKSEGVVRKRVRDMGHKWLFDVKAVARKSDLRTLTGLAAHPSLLSVVLQTGFDPGPTFFGEVTKTIPGSHFTLSQALTAVALPFSIIPEIPYDYRTADMMDPKRGGEFVPRNTQVGTWEGYCQKVRQLPFGLLMSSLRFTNATADEVTSNTSISERHGS